jgi:hypothetical protein
MPHNTVVPNTFEEFKSLAVADQKEGELQVEKPDYTPEETLYLSGIRNLLTRAKDSRDVPHEIFDGMDYVTRCRQNRRLANTYIRPKTNRGETAFSAGTPRRKLMVQMAALINMVLGPDITAYDEKLNQVSAFGEAIEDILEKAEDLEDDTERKLYRWYLLLSQGEVFVERLWEQGKEKVKTFSGKPGKFRGVTINQRVKKALGRLRTDIIANENVYLGDVTMFDMEEQPYLFTRQERPITALEPIFGTFEMWPYVQKSLSYFDSNVSTNSEFDAYWALYKPKKGFAEVLKYQSKPHNEVQVFINGIPMLPVGFPLTEISPEGTYSIQKQVFEPIEGSAYGKGLMQVLKLAGSLEDEFWRLAIQKTQQSFKPPTVNNTGKVLSPDIFLPGKMTYGLDPEKLKPLMDNRGVTQNEAAILNLVKENINQNSTDPQFAGQQASGVDTATEASLLAQQAEKMFGYTMFVIALLEQKLARMAIPLVLEHWFDPVDSKIDEVRGGLKSIYRSISVPKPLFGKGMGSEVVRVVDDETQPKPFDIFKEQVSTFKNTGVPTRIITLNRDVIKAARWTWRVRVVPKPRRSSNLQKLMFTEKVNLFAMSPNFNMDWFEEKAALIHDENPQEVFSRSGVAPGVTPPAGNKEMNAANFVNQDQKPSVNRVANEA